MYNNIKIELPENKNVYFASDIHLGAPDAKSSIKREQKFVQWLETIIPYCSDLFLVGDVFDFWFDYKHAVPKGGVRLLGTLAKMNDLGINIHIFTGNHDIWMADYFKVEFNAKIYHKPIILNIGDQKIFVAHGDGLGPGDTKFKILKKFFTFPFFQWCFRWLHPDIGIKIAQLWSAKSRTDPKVERFRGEEKEFLIQYAKRKQQEYPVNYYIMGHRHLPLEFLIEEGCTYFNLGDWIINNTYILYDGKKCTLKKMD